jgi:hypothetical protein
MPCIHVFYALCVRYCPTCLITNYILTLSFNLAYLQLEGVRKVQQSPVPFGGTVIGASDVSGASTSQGQAEVPTALGGASSNGSGNFGFESGASGFVDTKDGGAVGSGSSGVSGTSTATITDTTVNDQLLIGELTSSGSSQASAASAFEGEFSPFGSSGDTGGSGSGNGSLNAAGMASFIPTVVVEGKYICTIGTADTSAGGSATGFNALTSAGGQGSASAKGSTNSVVDGYDGATANVNGVATGTFTGNGSGTDGNIPNRPTLEDT